MKMQHNLINTFLVMTAAMPLLINASALSHDVSASSTPLSYYRHDTLRHTTGSISTGGVLEERPFLRRISTYTRGKKDEDDDDKKKNDDKANDDKYDDKNDDDEDNNDEKAFRIDDASTWPIWMYGVIGVGSMLAFMISSSLCLYCGLFESCGILPPNKNGNYCDDSDSSDSDGSPAATRSYRGDARSRISGLTIGS